MAFKSHTITNYYLFETPVENLFIAEYMPSAPGDYVKVYLAGLGCAAVGVADSSAAMAKKLGCSVAQIDEAWAYWEAQGVVRRVYKNREDRSVYDIEFISLREAAFGSRTPGASVAAPKSVDLDDDALAKLYRKVEASTGRLLESGEPVEIAGWMTDYSMDPDVILLCYEYCTKKGKSNRFKYVGTILKDWKAKGLDTVSDVEEHLSDLDRHYDLYRKVFRQMGFHRSPTEAEKKLMDSWFDEMGFSFEKVAEACGKTTGISNPNLNYINSILRGWYAEEHAVSEEPSEKSIFAAVEKLYEDDRKRNEEKTEALRNEIFTKLPRVRAINDELRDSNFKLSKMVLAGNRNGLEKERKNAARLIEEKKALLTAAGYGEDATDNIYTCRKCKDTGILENGERCSCYNEKLQVARLQAKGK